MSDQNRRRDSYHHRGGTTFLLGDTIPDYLADTTERFADREAIVSLHQNTRLTYRQLDEQVERAARALLTLGYGRGDRIGLWSTNNAEWIVLQLATARIGVILVVLNPAYRIAELKFALERSEVQCLILIPSFKTSEYVTMIRELVPDLDSAQPGSLRSDQLPSLQRVVLYDPLRPEETERPAPGLMTWQELLAEAEGTSSEALTEVTRGLDIDDGINIQYTSGTTGSPKPVLLTHHNLLNTGALAARELHFTEHDRLCVPVPLYHCFGMVLSNLMCLSVGACIVLPAEHFEPGAVLHALESERCTGLHGVPTMFIAELEHEDFAGTDCSTLRTGIMAGAPCPAPLMKRVMAELHCSEILIGYGQTEASPLTHMTSRGDTLERRTQTVGRNLPHQEVKIVDPETSATVPCGQVGEACFRGYHIMKEYYRDPQATAETVDDAGWLHSGDLGWMDEDGYVRITGRLKDMIIRGGENVYPAEVEACLFTHSRIAQVAVFGIPDDFYGEQVVAWIRLRPGQNLTEEDVREYCRDKLAHFKVPGIIEFVDEFPVTVTGKIQKFRMRDVVVAARGSSHKKG